MKTKHFVIAVGITVSASHSVYAQSGGSITNFEFSSVVLDYPVDIPNGHASALQATLGQPFFADGNSASSQNDSALGFWETSVKYVYTGNVSLQGFLSDATIIPLNFRLWNTFGDLSDSGNIYVNSQGNTIFQSWVNPTYASAISIKGDRWLRQRANLEPVGNPFLDYPFAVYSLIPGDVTGHNTIDRFDYNAFKNAFGTSAGNPNWNPMADLDGDGVVGRYDYNIFKLNFGKSGDN